MIARTNNQRTFRLIFSLKADHLEYSTAPHRDHLQNFANRSADKINFSLLITS